jgi:predicted DCC family thiol-disulfide oxidoreductase YuxK
MGSSTALPPRPVLVFDGDCGFCRRWLARWRRITGDGVEYAPYQEAAARFPRIPPQDFARAVHWIGSDGRVCTGAHAVFRALATAPGHGAWLWLYRHAPLFAPVSEACYGAVARNRERADRITTWLWGRHVVPPGEARTVALFLRLLGLVYVAAFLSLQVQIAGLLGSDGILPAQPYLDAARAQLGAERLWLLPTVLWLGAGDAALQALCTVGALGGLLAAAGVAPAATLGVAWLSYLSLSTVGQVFLHFQWDALLLEAGFLAILLAPWRLRSRLSGDPPPSRPMLWLARWLLFRLMFCSAVVKLASGDPSWHSLTALQFHYFTQPLPPWTAWYAQQLPAWFQTASVAMMFVIEGLAPFLLFGPRRVRFLGAAAIAALQLLILLTGNYGFFNLLALVLCVPVLDDGLLSRGSPPAAPPESGRQRGRWTRRVAASLLFAISLVPLSHAFRIGDIWPGPLVEAYQLAAPLQIVNPYGLFAVMTTERPEIVVEGSRDGREWQAYEFAYKPGDPSRRPVFTTPHMPRLDWQMWFAALGSWHQNRWFLAFCQRLLDGSAPVTALLARNPFAGAPPRFVRAQLYQYRFTTPQERRESGNWWVRTLEGRYLRDLTLVHGRLAPASEADGTR